MAPGIRSRVSRCRSKPVRYTERPRGSDIGHFFGLDGEVGDDKTHDIADNEADDEEQHALGRAVGAGGHHEAAQQAGGSPGGGGHLHQVHESAAEASAQTGGEEGLAHGEGDAVDQRLAHAQDAGGQSAGDDALEAVIAGLLALEVDGDGGAHLARAGHGQGGIEVHAAEGLQLHRVQGHQTVVHPHGHHGQEQGCAQVAADSADHRGGAHGHRAHDLHKARGDEARDGHHHQHVGHQGDNEGQQGGEDDVQGVGHLGADGPLNLAHAPHADDRSQHAAPAGPEDGVQGLGLVEQTHHLGDGVNAAQGGNHAQHAAQDGGAAELLRRPVARPSGQVGHEGGVNHAQEVGDKDQRGVLRAGEQLAQQSVQAGAQARGDDAGDQGNKDIAKGLEHALELVVLLPGLDGGLVRLPVAAGHSVSRGGDAQVLAVVGAFAALAGADHHLDVARPVMDNAHDALQALQGGLVDGAVVFHVDAQTGHAVGGGDDVLPAAHILQDALYQLLDSHFSCLSFFSGVKWNGICPPRGAENGGAILRCGFTE